MFSGVGSKVRSGFVTAWLNLAVKWIRFPSSDSNAGYSIAIGPGALIKQLAPAAYYNVAIGSNALGGALTTAAQYNTAVGGQALAVNTSGSQNSAFGTSALAANTSGSNNIAIGTNALQLNVSGVNNTAIGTGSGNQSQGNNNTFIGAAAGQGSGATAADSVMIGCQAGYAITSGNQNTLIGSNAGATLTTGINNIIIGYNRQAQGVGASNTMNIGDVIIANGMDSPTTCTVTIPGKLNLSLQNAAGLAAGGKNFLQYSSGSADYFILLDTGGVGALYLGGGTDPSNYYCNTNHRFQNRGNTVAYGMFTAGGLAILTGSTPTAALDVTGSAKFTGTVRSTTVTALGTTGTISIDPTLGDVFTVTPTAAITFNAASAPAGTHITLIVTTSGTTTFALTFGTNFKTQSILATGTVSAKKLSISFVGDGTNMVEISRVSTAM